MVVRALPQPAGDLPEVVLPDTSRRGERSFDDDGFDDERDERGLVGDVVVERHGCDPELVRDGAHREPVGTALVGDEQGRGGDAFPIEVGHEANGYETTTRTRPRFWTRANGLR